VCRLWRNKVGRMDCIGYLDEWRTMIRWWDDFVRDGLNKWPTPTFMRHNTLIILCQYFDAGTCSDIP
jgi:hypothetical protein